MTLLTAQRVKGFLAILLVCLAFGIPMFAGIHFLWGSLEDAENDAWVRVTLLSSLPDDGIPRRFLVQKSRRDAWMRLPDEPVGFVYLRRVPGTDHVIALSGMHRRGVTVEFNQQDRVFESVCWNVRFSISGKCLDPLPGFGDLRQIDTKVVAKNVLLRVAQLSEPVEP